MMFQLNEWTSATLKSVNLRGENHGPDVVPAFDLSLSTTLANDALAGFDNALKTALFKGSAQLPLAGVEGGSDAPALRFPHLGPLTWKDEADGYALALDDGVEGHAAIELGSVKVGKFALRPLEGGSVEIDFRCQSVAEPSAETIGAVGRLVARKVRVKLTMPATSVE